MSASLVLRHRDIASRNRTHARTAHFPRRDANSNDNMNALEIDNWSVDWAWSVPLIVISVVIHVFGLGLVTEQVDRILKRLEDRRRFHFHFRCWSWV